MSLRPWGVSLRIGRAARAKAQLPDRHFIAVINLNPGTMPLPHPDAFKMAKHIHVKTTLADEGEKQAIAAKTARLRASRLAKEAADRAAANREIAAAPTGTRGS